jgi:hypothetical protein
MYALSQGKGKSKRTLNSLVFASRIEQGMCSGGRDRARRISMKDFTIDRKNPASQEPVEELTPRADPPDEICSHKIIMTVGDTRYELRRYTEVRLIKKGPAKVIEMPLRTAMKP